MHENLKNINLIKMLFLNVQFDAIWPESNLGNHWSNLGSHAVIKSGTVDGPWAWLPWSK